nr:hypothetical protein [Tanacetum cinerariifolium]
MYVYKVLLIPTCQNQQGGRSGCILDSVFGLLLRLVSFEQGLLLLGKKVEAILKSAWIEKDQIDNFLNERRLMRSLEEFVGRRLYEPEPEGSTQGYPLVSVKVLSDEALKLKNFKKDASLKLFKLSNQERHEHVGPKSQVHKVRLFKSREYLLLVCRDNIGYREFTIYETMKACSVWTVRYLVNTDGFMTSHPEGWSIRSTVWSIGLKERENDSFLVVNANLKM